MTIKRTCIVTGIALLLLGLLLATVTVGQEGDGEPVDLDEIQEDVVRDLFDENGRMMNSASVWPGLPRNMKVDSAATTSTTPTRARSTSTC